MRTTEHSIETTVTPESTRAAVVRRGDTGRVERGHHLRPLRGRKHDCDDAGRPGHARAAPHEVSESKEFVDEAGDVVMRTVHRIDRLDEGRSLVTYRMEVTGPGADTVGAEPGSQISGDFPEVLAALVEKVAPRWQSDSP